MSENKNLFDLNQYSWPFSYSQHLNYSYLYLCLLNQNNKFGIYYEKLFMLYIAYDNKDLKYKKKSIVILFTMYRWMPQIRDKCTRTPSYRTSFIFLTHILNEQQAARSGKLGSPRVTHISSPPTPRRKRIRKMNPQPKNPHIFLKFQLPNATISTISSSTQMLKDLLILSPVFASMPN